MRPSTSKHAPAMRGVLAIPPVLLLALCPASGALAAKNETIARWRGKSVSADQLEAKFGAGLVAKVEAWAPWGESAGYLAHVEDQGRVVLWLAKDAKKVSEELDLVTRTCDAFERLVRHEPKSVNSGEGTEDGALEEFTADPDRELEPAVMVHTRDEEEYGAALDHAARLEPSLETWVPYGKKLTGFTLHRPLASGWAVRAKGRVEWDPENEVVHRLTSLLVMREFGEVPYWLLAGTAWHAEIELCGDVYCFPYRSEFVWATEHEAWPRELENLFDERRESFLPGLVGWKRGTYDGDRAKEAWGFARFVAGREGILGAILAEFAAVRRRDGIERFPDGRWQVIVGWEPSVETTRDILARHLGDDFEEKAVQEFTKGTPKAAKPKRRRP